MTIIEAPADDLPRLYLACPLTNLTPERQRSILSEITQVRRAVEALTVGDRVPTEAWPVAVYAPIDSTAPWSGDGLSSLSVYERNFTQVLDADALIVLADIAASAGVGQEVEWACRTGIPVLYLTCSKTVSRQIDGIPGDVSCVAYNNHPETLAAHIENFLRGAKLRILDGPRRRASRRIRFEALTVRLRQAWLDCPDPTGVASRCLVTPTFVTMMLADAARTATISHDTLTLLAADLGVPVTSVARQLPVPATRALILAAVEGGWSDQLVERLRLHGLAALSVDPDVDLATLEAWRTLAADI